MNKYKLIVIVALMVFGYVKLTGFYFNQGVLHEKHRKKMIVEREIEGQIESSRLERKKREAAREEFARIARSILTFGSITD